MDTRPDSPLPEDNLAWFDSSGSAPTAPPRRKPSIKPLIILSAAVVLLLGGALLLMALHAQNSTCLTASDYRDLTGSQYVGTLDPTSSFYTDFISFKPTSTDYADDSGTALIERLSSFYTSHETKPMLVTVGASYSPGQDLELVQSRIDTVTDALTRAGISADTVRQDEPILINPEEPDTAEPTADAVSIIVSSPESCR